MVLVMYRELIVHTMSAKWNLNYVLQCVYYICNVCIEQWSSFWTIYETFVGRLMINIYRIHELMSLLLYVLSMYVSLCAINKIKNLNACIIYMPSMEVPEIV